MTITREQLELAAKAAGIELDFDRGVVKSWVRDYESMWHVHKFPFVRGDFTSLAEAVITAAAEQQLAKETKS